MVTQPEGDEPTDEEHGHVLDVDSIFGVRIVRDADPGAHAQQLAAEVSGELVRDLEHAERAFAARAEAGKTEPIVLRDSERLELETVADGMDAGDPNVNDAAISELRQLADELSMTERIRSDTEAEFTESLSRRLSAASAVAIHPSAIRQAAATVTEAESEVARCDIDLAALGELPSAASGERDPSVGPERTDGPENAHPELFNEGALEHNRRLVALSIGIVVFFAGGAVVLLQTGVPIFVPIIVFVVGLVISVSAVVRNRVRVHDDRSAKREASELLASATAHDLAASNQPTPLAMALPPPLTEEEWLARRVHLETGRKSATERLRSARKHWESLVGPDADPHDVEDLLRVRDPQLELVGAASRTSPTVRTVSAVHRRTLARWRVAWAGVGYDEPPEPDAIHTHLERLRAAGSQRAAAARERLQAARLWSEACATIDRPIVLIEPEQWLAEDALEAMLGTLPAGAEVLIVEPLDPEAGDTGDH